MKKSKFTESQIAFAIKQAETGTKVDEVCSQMGISSATFFNWKKKYGGLGISELRRLRQFEEENQQLKKLVADLSLDKHMLQEVIKKALKPSFKKRLALWLQDQFRVSIRRACANVKLSPSMFYYERADKGDDLLRMRLRDIALTRVRYGFWRLFVLLRREGFTDNHKLVFRVYKEEGLNLPSKRP
jgi:putative transposase